MHSSSVERNMFFFSFTIISIQVMYIDINQKLSVSFKDEYLCKMKYLHMYKDKAVSVYIIFLVHLFLSFLKYQQSPGCM